jgi:catalase-peroxidase
VDLINGRSKWSTDTSCTSKDWEVNNPVQLKKVLEVFDHIQAEFNKTQSDDKKVSIADLIVLVAQLLKKQQKRWSSCDSAFTAGRAASQEQTDAESFDVLEPKQTVFVIT